jgi:hypothetical protein
MQDKSIEISMKPAYLKFNYVYVPVAYTDFFPPGRPQTKTTVRIASDKVWTNAQLQYNSKARV